MTPWWAGLDARVHQEVRDLRPGRSDEQIGIDAAENPAYAAAFERLGVWVSRAADRSADEPGVFARALPPSPDDPDELVIPEKSHAAARELLVASVRDLTAREQDTAPIGEDLDLGGDPYPQRVLVAIGKTRAQGKESIRDAQAADQLSASATGTLMVQGRCRALGQGPRSSARAGTSTDQHRDEPETDPP